jgi:hypothetical protein
LGKFRFFFAFCQEGDLAATGSLRGSLEVDSSKHKGHGAESVLSAVPLASCHESDGAFPVFPIFCSPAPIAALGLPQLPDGHGYRFHGLALVTAKIVPCLGQITASRFKRINCRMDVWTTLRYWNSHRHGRWSRYGYRRTHGLYLGAYGKESHAHDSKSR